MTSARTLRLRPRALAPFVLALASLLLALPGVRAEESPSDEYGRVIDEALAEFASRNYVEAHALFLRAHAIEPNARTLRGLGVVSFELRRYAACVTYLDAALVAEVRPLDGTLRSSAERLRERARSFVGELWLTLAPAEATIQVDGFPVERPPAGAPLWLDLGDHTLRFEAEGYAAQQRGLTVRGSEANRWDVSLRPRSPTGLPQAALDPADEGVQPAPLSRDDRAPKRLGLARKVTAISLAGAGAVSLGLMGYFASVHTEDGREVRMRDADDIRAQNAWLDSRTAPLALAGVGSGLLAVSGALVADTVPRRHRRWVAPLLLAAGAGTLATGLVLVSRGAACPDESERQTRACVLEGERRDRGAMVAMISAPLLTVPITQAIAWWRGGR